MPSAETEEIGETAETEEIEQTEGPKR